MVYSRTSNHRPTAAAQLTETSFDWLEGTLSNQTSLDLQGDVRFPPSYALSFTSDYPQGTVLPELAANYKESSGTLHTGDVLSLEDIEMMYWPPKFSTHHQQTEDQPAKAFNQKENRYKPTSLVTDDADHQNLDGNLQDVANYKSHRKAPRQQKSELGIHRTFKCTEGNCSTPPFGTQAGLLRHRREVHHLDTNGNPVRKFPCPETSCVRHKRGFGRQSNMVQHLRRRHANQPFASSNSNEASVSPNYCPTPAITELSDSEGDEVTASLARVPMSVPDSVCGELRAKLVRLEQEKERIDAEVEAVRKVIEVFERKGEPVGLD